LRVAALLLFLFSVTSSLFPLFAQSAPATTTITGQLFTAQASPLPARVQIVNPPFVSPDGFQVAAGNITVAAPGGALTVNLVPTIGASPAGVTYSVVITTAAGLRENQTWTVPVSSTPVSINAVSNVAQGTVLALPTVPAGGGLGGTFPDPTVNVTPPLVSNPTTIFLPQASGSQSGYLASSDWTKFNSGASLNFTLPLSNSGGTISMPQASGSQNGYLASTDWTKFNSGASLNFTLPLSNSGGTISCAVASASQPGCLASADWTTFNSKQAALGFTPENSANKNAANGYAGLSGGLLSHAQLPPLVSADIPNNAANTSGQAATAGALAAAGAPCTPGQQYAYGVNASGAALCQTIGQSSRSVTAATDTLAVTDNNFNVICNYASGCAETLPTAIALGNSAFDVYIYGGAGAATVTPNTWPIYPGGVASASVATLVVPSGWGCYFSVDPAGLIWDVSCHLALMQNAVTVAATASAAGNFTVAHGLGRKPIEAIITMTSAGVIWCQSTCFDGTNLYLVASDASLTAAVRVK
jgi:hypothetical protein